MQYKVGDRVIATDNLGIHENEPGTIVNLWFDMSHPTPYAVKFDNDGCEFLWSQVHSLTHHNKKIVITTDGKTTLARLYEDGKVVKNATAKCHADDEFNFNTGAEIAFNRLIGKSIVEEATPKYYNGKVVCVSSIGDGFTVGKVYEFKEGTVLDNDFVERPAHGHKITSLDEKYMQNWTYKFIPYVE